MHKQVRCSSCGGSGTSYTGSPTDPYSSISCFSCHGTGTITKYVSSGNVGRVNVANGKVDTRSEEEKKTDRVNGFARLVSFILACCIWGPVFYQGGISWWIPVSLGVISYIGLAKLFEGPLRTVTSITADICRTILLGIAVTVTILFLIGAVYVFILATS